jgi:murein DD-endopeptidase MepM/ murein hydrolase activator NlpD
MISSGFRDVNSPAAVAYGADIINWLRGDHAQFGVHYIIYRQRIWNVERNDEGWRLMIDRGNPTANHMDHVHVSTYGNASQSSTAAPAVLPAGKAVTPVEHYTITATFGQVGSWSRYHTGLDFAAPVGTPVRGALAGSVIHAGYGAAASWAGNYVTIGHADGSSTLYAHLSRIDVQSGDRVATGQLIGAIGMTGRSFGSHLHFETYPAGTQPWDVYAATDPARWLRAHGVTTAVPRRNRPPSRPLLPPTALRPHPRRPRRRRPPRLQLRPTQVAEPRNR